MGLQGEDRLVIALAAPQHFADPVEHIQVRQEHADGPATQTLFVFRGQGAELPQVPQQLRQAAGVVHVGVGDENAVGTQLVDSKQVRGVRAVLPRVQKIELSAGLQGDAGVVASGHGLGAGTAAENVQNHKNASVF